MLRTQRNISLEEITQALVEEENRNAPSGKSRRGRAKMHTELRDIQRSRKITGDATFAGKKTIRQRTAGRRGRLEKLMRLKKTHERYREWQELP